MDAVSESVFFCFDMSGRFMCLVRSPVSYQPVHVSFTSSFWDFVEYDIHLVLSLLWSFDSCGSFLAMELLFVGFYLV